MTDDVFKLPGNSYEQISKIIQAYTHVVERVPLASVAKLLQTDDTVVSRNNAFLASVGIIEGGQKKGITSTGARLGRALEFNHQEDVHRTWRELLAPHPLVDRILAAVRIRGGMDAATLTSHIVYTAGVKKTPAATTGAAALVEMLTVAGLLADRDGKYVVATSSGAANLAGKETDPPDLPQPADVPIVPRVTAAWRETSDVEVRLDLRVVVAATAQDLPGLGETLRQLLADVTRPMQSPSDGHEDADL